MAGGLQTTEGLDHPKLWQKMSKNLRALGYHGFLTPKKITMQIKSISYRLMYYPASLNHTMLYGVGA